MLIIYNMLKGYKNLSWVWGWDRKKNVIGITRIAEWKQTVIASDVFFYLIHT